MATSGCLLCAAELAHPPELCAGWDRGWLAPYGRTAGDEDAARAAWTEIVDLACEHDGFAVALGAALGSVFLDPLDSTSFVLHLTGGPAEPRTQLLRAAMAVVGDPGELVRTWPPSTAEVFDRLAAAAILPVAFDGMDGVPEDTLARMVRGHDPGPHAPWTLSIFAAGDPLLSDPETAPARLGWVEAPIPVVHDEHLTQRVHDLAVAHHGWPLRWLATSRVLIDMPQWHPPALASLSVSAPTVATRAMARHLSACVVGFGALGRLVGRGLAVFAGIGAADQILTRLGDRSRRRESGQRAYLVSSVLAASDG
jgi:hypothetical protein